MRKVIFSLAATGAFAVNPISRVAELLTNLSKQIEDEGKAEEKLFKKYVCWFKQTVKEKTTSNAEAEARIEQLATFIDDVKNGRIEFTTERQDREKELAEINAQLESAKNLREQENKDFLAAEDELQKGVNALNDAVNILQAGTKGSFLVKKFDIRKVLQLGQVGLSRSDMHFLERALDVPEKDWEKLNREATFKKKYSKRSGEIQDTLAKMHQNFSDNLQEARDKEQEAKDTYEKLRSAKMDEKEQAEQALLDLKDENGARGMNLQDAQSEKSKLENQVTNDTKFMQQVTKSHEVKLGEWKERKRLRTEEVASIAQAISILRSDDARDLFKKSFESQGYLFVQKELAHNPSDKKLRALALIYKSLSGDKKKARRVAARFGRAVEGVADVITAIDEMLVELQKENDNDHEWKEECEKFQHNKKTKALKHARTVDDEQATMERKEALMKELQEKIADSKQKIAELEEQLKEATRQRQDENAEYKANKADDKAAVVLIGKAIGALEKFYTDNNLAFIQNALSAPGEAPAPPPKTWDSTYGGKKEENNGVVGILSLIKEDVKKDIRVATEAENEAETEFQEFKTNTELDIQNEKDAIADFETSHADALDAKNVAATERNTAQKLLDAEKKEFTAKEPDCFFIAYNFGTRKSNRQQEKDGLLQAKRILQGSD